MLATYRDVVPRLEPFGLAAMYGELHGGTDAEALIELGDAESHAGNHDAALRAYRRVTRSAEAKTREALALLRMGRLSDAKSAAGSVLSRDPGAAEAILIRGAALYAEGDLETARSSFERVASDPDANPARAQAAYNLGLTCIRLGQRDAALAAFAAAVRALERGSSPGATPDETISPALGRAIVALAEGDLAQVRTELVTARLEAPQKRRGAARQVVEFGHE